MNKPSDNGAKRDVFAQIVARRRFTIPAISEAAGISMTTVSKYVDELQSAGFLCASGYVDTGRKGRRPVLYELCSDSNCFLGIDIKSFELNLGLMNLAGEMVRVCHMSDFRFDNTYGKIDEICRRVQEFIAEDGDAGRKILSANFNISGRVNSVLGTSASIFNFEDAQDVSLARTLTERLGITSYIENDSKVMAYGEYCSLPALECRNMLYVNVSEGIGMGIIIDGEIYYGKDGYAGELGHIYRYDNDIMCQCGKKGCFETEVSGRAIRRKLHERVYNHAGSLLAKNVWAQKDITMSHIIEASEKGDQLCIELLAETGRELGKELAGLVNLMNPECIIIGGSIARAPEEFFLGPLCNMVRQHTLGLMSRQLRISASRLGQQAGIIGACMISRRKTLGGLLSLE